MRKLYNAPPHFENLLAQPSSMKDLWPLLSKTSLRTAALPSINKTCFSPAHCTGLSHLSFASRLECNKVTSCMDAAHTIDIHIEMSPTHHSTGIRITHPKFDWHVQGLPQKGPKPDSARSGHQLQKCTMKLPPKATTAGLNLNLNLPFRITQPSAGGAHRIWC